MLENIDEKWKKFLIRAIDEILWYRWDPIRVNLNYAMRNEYSGYVPEVYEKIFAHVDEKSIADLLCRISKEKMGSCNDYDVMVSQRAAKFIAKAKEEIDDWSDETVDALGKQNGYVK